MPGHFHAILFIGHKREVREHVWAHGHAPMQCGRAHVEQLQAEKRDHYVTL
jgi:hypothetical protein